MQHSAGQKRHQPRTVDKTAMFYQNGNLVTTLRLRGSAMKMPLFKRMRTVSFPEHHWFAPSDRVLPQVLLFLSDGTSREGRLAHLSLRGVRFSAAAQGSDATVQQLSIYVRDTGFLSFPVEVCQASRQEGVQLAVFAKLDRATLSTLKEIIKCHCFHEPLLEYAAAGASNDGQVIPKAGRVVKRMASAYPLTRKPIDLGRHLQLKNRVYFAPMGIDLGREGCLTDEMFGFYRGIVDGGCAMVVLANSAVDASTRLHAGGLCLYDNRHAEALEPLIDYGRQQACPVVVQLQHYGAQGDRARSGGVLLAPSRIAPGRSRPGIRVATHEDIRAVCRQFAHAAHLARRAGARAVQLQASNGYLLSSFLSPYSNRRTDRYGGSPLRRARLLLEVIEAVAEATQGEVDISVRLGIDDCLGERGSSQPCSNRSCRPCKGRVSAR